MEEKMEKKLEEASEYYKNQLPGLIGAAFKEGEVKGVKETFRHSFLLGYQVGLDYAKVPKGSHLREPPVVPEVELSNHLLPSKQPDPAPILMKMPPRSASGIPCNFLDFSIYFVIGAGKEQYAIAEPH
ncbi:hypothetical protein RHSIM_Rhsim13G0131300 [Rhododendron simsii]|uniref:Uncharacterized protein n=1 Tax=Rhododendron simsii TaxID=118357 RepID=A0A834G197_RHOSS|nr:hypothetical protein RHSIM_Rhsim13G0131300 [Rhododendron simsii]